jgi:hypothetical protein
MADKYQRYKSGNPVCDAFRFLCDASFAVLPRDAAHKLGEFEKNFWGGVRWFAEKNIERIDVSLAFADWLRNEWQSRAERAATEATAGPEPL